VTAAERMIERTIDRFDLYPARLAGDCAYGSAEMLSWLVDQHGIEPHVTVFDESARRDGTFSREDFAYNRERDVYVCPAGKTLTTRGTLVNDGATLLYRASKFTCDACALKPRCCPKKARAQGSALPLRGGARHGPPHRAKSEAGRASRWQRKKVEILFAHLKAHPPPRPAEAARPERCPRRVPLGRDRSKPSQTGETDHPAKAAAGDLSAGHPVASLNAVSGRRDPQLATDPLNFFNRIDPKPPFTASVASDVLEVASRHSSSIAPCEKSRIVQWYDAPPDQQDAACFTLHSGRSPVISSGAARRIRENGAS
jgi:Transposase DDE domain